MNELLLMGYEEQLRALEVLKSDRDFKLIDDEIIKNLLTEEELRRRMERLKTELKKEEIEP